MMKSDYDGSRSHEEKRFKKRVSKDVKDAATISAQTDGDKHISQLAHGRVGEYLFYVALIRRDDGGKKSGSRADGSDEQTNVGDKLVDETISRHHVNAGRDHGRRVDERRDGSGSRHRVWQPNVQRNLRRLAHGSHKQKHADNRERVEVNEVNVRFYAIKRKTMPFE